ncbi:MAG: response regulator, partial [Bacteroidota bacterium]
VLPHGAAVVGPYAAHVMPFTKPIKPGRLFAALEVRAALSAPMPPVETQEVATPSGSAEAATEAPAQEAGSVLSELRILLVEDNATNRKVLLHLLKRAGYHADVAQNGLEAVEAACRTAYDLVLMDHQMPVMDGLEAARRIRRQASHQPRIVSVTANAMAQDRQLSQEAGMDDFVAKPVEVERIQKVLQETEDLLAHQVGLS